MKIDQKWVRSPSLQKILGLLNADGEEARVAGGAVRNALLEESIADIDIATTRLPQDVAALLQEEGHKIVPTGIEHGTITAVVDGDAYEVTTLRQDVETDGRHATVSFGRDWTEDARRRDFTMNALYMEADGKVVDPLGGYEDLIKRRVVFIDDPEMRIREDYLRILRFFRFFAWYGAFRPDAEGLKACTRLKDGLSGLSVERIWQEIVKLLSAPDPSRAILWTRQTGVLTAVLPETENWGIDALHGLVETGKEQGWRPDPVLRLISMLPPQDDKLDAMAKRLKLPNKVRDRLTEWAQSTVPDISAKKIEFYKQLYRGNEQGIKDCLRLIIAKEQANGNAKPARKYAKRLKQAEKWKCPVLPVRGQDIIDTGVEPGPEVSKRLVEMEKRWVDSGFVLESGALLAQAGAKFR